MLSMTTPDFEQVVVLSISTAQVFQLALIGFSSSHVALQESLLGTAALVKQPLHLSPVVLHYLGPFLHSFREDWWDD